MRNARCDILAYNLAYDWLMGGLDAIPFEDRNTLIQCLTNPAWRRSLPTGNSTCPGWSPDSARRWPSTSPNRRGRTWSNGCGRSPNSSSGCGRKFSYLYLDRRSEISLATLTPADEETAAKLPSSF